MRFTSSGRPATPSVAIEPLTGAGAGPALGAAPAAPRPAAVRRDRRPLIAGALLVLALAAMVGWLLVSLPLSRALEPLQSPTLVLVSADGHAFARRGAFKEEPVDVTRLPAYVGQAFVAIEDRRFYQHHGVDPAGIVRALWTNLRSGRLRQGGSTITQQLAKNAFLTSERTLRRKVQEAVIAVYLETRLSKNDILSRYLSSVYFGDGVFGLRAAARHYFNKGPEQLTMGEAAMLAGLVESPTRLAPTHDLPAASRRQQQVLQAMVSTHAITPAQAFAARRVVLHPGAQMRPVGSYFADWISSHSRDRFDRAFGEVRVATTLDSRLQQQAEAVVRRTLSGPGRAMGATQAAVVAMRTDGSIVAMVGGRDYRQSQYNRASDALRQPGSAFKLFVYLAALRAGATPDTMVMDAPIRIGDWTPQNYEGDFTGGPVTLRDAFAHSSNVAAVRLSEGIGRSRVIQAARDLGITSPLPDSPAVALGAGSVSLMQLTAAYAAIAADMAPVLPHGLAGERSSPGRTLTPAERSGMLDLMHAVVTSGTGRAANLPIGAYGKTGTSQDYRDAWFIGFVGDLVIGVWVGNDDNTPMRHVTGGSLPAQMWREVMSYAIARVGVRIQAAPATPAPRPTGLGALFSPPPAQDEPAPLIAPPPQDFVEPGATEPVDGRSAPLTLQPALRQPGGALVAPPRDGGDDPGLPSPRARDEAAPPAAAENRDGEGSGDDADKSQDNP